MKKMLMLASTKSHLTQFHGHYIQECSKYYLLDLAYPLTPEHPEKISLNGEDIFIPFTKKYGSLRNLQALSLLIKLLRKKHYDKIICHTTLASVLLRFAILLSKEKSFVISVVHGYLFHETSSCLKTILFLGLEKCLGKFTNLLLVMNDWDEKIAKKYELSQKIERIQGMGVKFPEMMDENIKVYFSFFSSVDSVSFPVCSTFSAGTFLLAYGGEFSSRKNQSFLIRRMKDLPEEICLVLAGTGELWETCRTLAQQEGVSHRVQFVGQVTPLSLLYAQADVVVSSSYSEGLPFHVLEGMALGKYLLLSKVKGHTDLVKSPEQGTLFSLDKPLDFTEKVLHLQQWMAQHSAMSAVNKQRFQQHYELSQVAPRVLALYLHGREAFELL